MMSSKSNVQRAHSLMISHISVQRRDSGTILMAPKYTAKHVSSGSEDLDNERAPK